MMQLNMFSEVAFSRNGVAKVSNANISSIKMLNLRILYKILQLLALNIYFHNSKLDFVKHCPTLLSNIQHHFSGLNFSMNTSVIVEKNICLL